MPDHIASRPAATRVRLRILRNAGVAVTFALLAIGGTVAPAAAWSTGFSSSDEQLLFSLTNQDRASAGLHSLVYDSYLHKEAEWRVKDMADRNYFSHKIPPTNVMVFTFMQKDGYCFNVAGENIGSSTYPDDTATAYIETGFMGSPTHRDNILGTWNNMGVGAYKAADGHKLYAVLFSIPCTAPKPTPKPTPKLTPRPTTAPTANPTTPPTANPTTPPTANPTATPTANPTETTIPTTANPTATTIPSATSTPTMQVTDQPTPGVSSSEPSSATPSATPSATVTPSQTSEIGSEPSSLPSNVGATGTGAPSSGTMIGDNSGLRIRNQPPSGSLLGSVFQTMFGGFFDS